MQARSCRADGWTLAPLYKELEVEALNRKPFSPFIFEPFVNPYSPLNSVSLKAPVFPPKPVGFDPKRSPA